jgi:hypothetical protein
MHICKLLPYIFCAIRIRDLSMDLFLCFSAQLGTGSSMHIYAYVRMV